MRIDYRLMPSPVLGALLLVVASPGATGSGIRQQEGQQSTIAVKSGRPLADAVEALEKRHGVVITYEDVPNLGPDQLRDVTDQIRRDPSKTGGRRTLVPRGGALAFSYDVPHGASGEELAVVLRGLVSQYNSQGYPGRFEVQRTGPVLHVVPTERRSRGGVNETFEPLLNTPIEAAAAGVSQSALEALQQVVEALSRTTGAQVLLGAFPTNLLSQTRVTRTGGTSPARDELVKILESTAERLSWQLFFDPNEPQRWFLNVHIVR